MTTAPAARPPRADLPPSLQRFLAQLIGNGQQPGTVQMLRFMATEAEAEANHANADAAARWSVLANVLKNGADSLQAACRDAATETREAPPSE